MRIGTSKVFGVAAFAWAVVACSSAPQNESSAGEDSLSAYASDADATTDAGESDGTPIRRACTGSLGSGLTGSSFGRLDGTIVSVVLPGGSKSCNADSTHVHLQVEANGSTYDIAVNIDGGFLDEFDHALVGEPWTEGWHAGQSLDYPTNLGIHDADFAAGNQATLEREVEAAVASANHISVFATAYNHSGAHLVHRQGKKNDGAIFLDPLSATPHVLAFHFSNQTF